MDKLHEPDALSRASRRSAPGIFVNIFCRGTSTQCQDATFDESSAAERPQSPSTCNENQSKLTRYAAVAIFDAGKRTRERVNPGAGTDAVATKFWTFRDTTVCLAGSMGGAEVRVAAI